MRVDEVEMPMLRPIAGDARTLTPEELTRGLICDWPDHIVTLDVLAPATALRVHPDGILVVPVCSSCLAMPCEYGRIVSSNGDARRGPRRGYKKGVVET
jgi:hypothetical protein